MRINEEWHTARFKERNLYGKADRLCVLGYSRYSVRIGDLILFECQDRRRLGRVLSLAVRDDQTTRTADHLWCAVTDEMFTFGYEMIAPFKSVREILDPHRTDNAWTKAFFCSRMPSPETYRAMVEYGAVSNSYASKYMPDGQIQKTFNPNGPPVFTGSRRRGG